MRRIHFCFGLLILTLLCSAVFVPSSVSADDSVIDEINITVPISCTLSGAGQNSHNATINNGQYNSAIGETTIKAFCNDNNGFSIYAIGYTGNINGKNILTDTNLGSSYDITTGTATTGNDSKWAMKLSTITSPEPTYPITIQTDTEGSFSNFHTVPDDYTLVAKRTSNTDLGASAEGSTLKSTYQAYISPTQAAGTYTGQVKYVLIHPHNSAKPLETVLNTGKTVSAKMKTLAAGTDKAYNAATNNIKAIRMADTLPANFEATEANTVSAPDSKYPIYIFFDNTNNAGIMYFYTEGDSVGIPEDSSWMFAGNTALSDISGLEYFDSSMATDFTALLSSCPALTNLDALADWDTSNVTTMNGLLMAMGYTSHLTDISGLANWNTSKVTNMGYLLLNATQLTSAEAIEGWDTSSVTMMGAMFMLNSSLTSLDLSGWDTSNVENMFGVFNGASSLTSLNVSTWDTSKVKNMSYLFHHAKSLTSIDLSGWDTSNVTDMSQMFCVGDSYLGNGQLSEIIGLENFDTSNVIDMTSMFYGAGQMTHYEISNWDVSKVESFNHMFCDNFALESLNLSKWNVSSAKTVYDMFDDAQELTTLGDISHWDTGNLIDLGGFLNGATSFVGNNGVLDLSGWDTSSLKSSGEVFRATKLQTIDLSGWTFDSVINGGWDGAGNGIYYEYGNSDSTYNGFGGMFKNASLLTTVYISQSGLNSFNTAVNNGVNTLNMWSGSGTSGFTVK